MFQSIPKKFLKWLPIGGIALIAVLFFLFKSQSISLVADNQLKTFVSSEYVFRINYPVGLDLVETHGSSNSMGRFLSVDIGTSEELKLINQANESSGAGGPLLFLRLTVADLQEQGELECGEFTKIRDLVLDGEKGVLCGGKTMVSDQAIIAMVVHEGRKFVFESGKYSESSKADIDGIVESLKFGL